MRPRVMHVVVGGDIGGAERLLVELARRPEASGADHEIALLTPNDRLHDLFNDEGLCVHRGRARREHPLTYLRQSLGSADVTWLASLLVARRASIVHMHTFGSHVIGTRAALRCSLPRVRTEHHVMHYEDASTSAFTRWAARRTDRLVAVSEYVRSGVLRALPEAASKASVVRNGIDPSVFRAPPRRDDGSAFRVGFVGRLAPWKRVDIAIDAAAREDVRLVVVGEGECRGALERFARRRRARVQFVGYQDDVRPFIATCDVTVNTSEREALPLSVLESLAMERPVVAFARGGIPEIVRDGVTGWLASGSGAKPFADALGRACAERARLAEMGARGRDFVVNEAGVEATCRGYASLYASVSART